MKSHVKHFVGFRDREYKGTNFNVRKIHFYFPGKILIAMVHTFTVFKKSSPNGQLCAYLGKRDFVTNLAAADPIDGVVSVEEGYLESRCLYAQLVCTFRYGREEDEVMGLKFSKEMVIASQTIFPRETCDFKTTRLQDRLVRKLQGSNRTVHPFTFTFPLNAPPSVTLQPGPEDQGKPCGVEYFVKLFPGKDPSDKSHKRSTVQLTIRKIEYAPSGKGTQPSTIVTKEFLLSPGQLKLETTLDKQLYHHGEKILVSIIVRNQSKKTVKKIRAVVQQCIDVCIFSSGQYKATVTTVDSQEGCPLEPGSTLKKTLCLVPTLSKNNDRRGIALDGQLKREETDLASSTLLTDGDDRDAFGIIVSYIVKVKLFLGAMTGELTAETPFILMHPKPKPSKLIRGDSEAGIEAFRQDTFDEYKPSEDTIQENDN